jgi:hypothetical protein
MTEAEIIILRQVELETDDGFIVVLFEDKDEQSPFRQMLKVPK